MLLMLADSGFLTFTPIVMMKTEIPVLVLSLQHTRPSRSCSPMGLTGTPTVLRKCVCLNQFSEPVFLSGSWHEVVGGSVPFQCLCPMSFVWKIQVVFGDEHYAQVRAEEFLESDCAADGQACPQAAGLVERIVSGLECQPCLSVHHCMQSHFEWRHSSRVQCQQCADWSADANASATARERVWRRAGKTPRGFPRRRECTSLLWLRLAHLWFIQVHVPAVLESIEKDRRAWHSSFKLVDHV